jgi:hypothetical protein
MNPLPPAGTANFDQLTQNSSFYREFEAERTEILRHKWLLSEKKGSDIGFERALFDWVIRHRTAWRSERARRLRDA